MIQPKYDIQKLEHMSDVLKAISHPLRIAIVDLLIQTDELSVNDIHKLLNILQPEASRQLKILKNAGLIDCKKMGNVRLYYLVDKDISGLLNCLENCSLK